MRKNRLEYDRYEHLEKKDQLSSQEDNYESDIERNRERVGQGKK